MACSRVRYWLLFYLTQFGYADDNAIGAQHNWRLLPNEQKTEICFFHLNHREANRKLMVTFRSKLLEHNDFPTYLGKTMDKTLTDKKHLEKVSQKLKSRNNILHKLAGTSWGFDGSTLRTAALDLVYSILLPVMAQQRPCKQGGHPAS